jgi:hypothetical protein
MILAGSIAAPARQPGGTRLEVVFGPRTRLAGALFSQVGFGRGEVALVARDDREADLVEQARPGSRLLRADRSEPPQPWGDRDLRIYCCALGPIHPEDSPEIGADAERTGRDLELIRRLAEASANVPIHVIYVSSVLAVAPREERRYYAGWKALIESELISILAEHPASTLSVLYPGRLVDDTAGLPARLLHTTYDRLAGRLASQGPGSRQRLVVGTDSRLFIVRHRGLGVSKDPQPSTADLPMDELAAALSARRPR